MQIVVQVMAGLGLAGSVLLAAGCAPGGDGEAPGGPVIVVPTAAVWDAGNLAASSDAFGRSLVANDVPALIRLFTAEGLSSATALQGQLLGRDTAVTAVSAAIDPGEGEGRTVRFAVTTAGGTSTLVTHWVQQAGAWKISGIAVTP